MALKVGERAKAFALEDSRGKTVRLADFEGEKLLVFFYPQAETPACTLQACSVRDVRRDLAKLGVAAVGISPDPIPALRAFDRNHRFGFPLLSDPDHAVARAWGVWGKKQMYGRTYDGLIRSWFLVDERGTIAGVWFRVRPEALIPKVKAALPR